MGIGFLKVAVLAKKLSIRSRLVVIMVVIAAVGVNSESVWTDIGGHKKMLPLAF